MRHLVAVIFVSLGVCCLIIGLPLLAQPSTVGSAGSSRIVVDADGKGDFRSIQDALNSLPDQSSTSRLIFIRKGVYYEKIFLEKSNVILQGEDREHTILTFSLARDACQTTRLKVLHCTLRAFGGDTVSPWNVAAGLFYFKDCRMEGGVDFYCPRGWAYAENCTFVALNGPACIWHDGSVDPDSKTVLKDCHFSGYDGKEYKWYANNLDEAPGAPAPETIDPAWVFKEKWNPLK